MEKSNNFSKNNPIVIDIGSFLSRSGFAGENQPRSIFPTLIGYPKSKSEVPDEYYIGEEALFLKEYLELKDPLEDGIILNWDDMEKIWDKIFYSELKVDPSKHPILLTEPPLNPRLKRERTAEIMFEKYQVPALYILTDALLSLYAFGLTTGCTIDIGYKGTRIVPIYDTFVISHAIRYFDSGGRNITDYLNRLLRQKGHKFTFPTEEEIVRNIKEKLCYLAADPEKEMLLSRESGEYIKKYTLPDGKIIDIDIERFLAPELLFQGIISGKSDITLIEEIYSAVRECDEDMRLEIYSNMVLNGGTSQFPGLKERLTSEIKKFIPEYIQVNVNCSTISKIAAWMGGSILASCEPFSKMWVTKNEYKDIGSKIIHRCF